MAPWKEQLHQALPSMIMFNHPSEVKGERLIGIRLPEELAWPKDGHALSAVDEIRRLIVEGICHDKS